MTSRRRTESERKERAALLARCQAAVEQSRQLRARLPDPTRALMPPPSADRPIGYANLAEWNADEH